MASVHDVAAYVTDYFDTSISTMKLQKLCFFGQGWTYALIGERLFDEDFQAWRNGPVCRELFDGHKGDFSVGSWPAGDASKLDERERIVLNAMLKNYGALSGIQLSELTHKMGTPWRTTREAYGLTDGRSSNAIITKDSIKMYFQRTLRAEKI